MRVLDACCSITCVEDLLQLQADGETLTARLTDGEAVEMDIHDNFDRRAADATGCVFYRQWINTVQT